MSGTVAQYSPVEVDFTPDANLGLIFDGLHVDQELGRPFLIKLDMSSGTIKSDAWKLVGSSASIWLYQAANTESPDNYFHGIVTRVISAGLSGGAYRYQMEIRPWIWLLSQVEDCKIFQNKSAFQIVTQVFRDAGFSDFEDKRQSASGDAVLEYCVQYRETSLDFVTRLMEHYGFYYYFTFTKTSHTVVLVDDPNAHTLLSPAVPYKFDQTEQRMVDDHLWQLTSNLELLSGKWRTQDYNFETPSADLTAKTVQPGPHSLYNSFEVYEYPGVYDTEGNGTKLSDVRMQSIGARRNIFTGTSNSRKLLSGMKFTLTKHEDTSLNQEYLIIRSLTTMTQAEGNPNPEAETVDTYRVNLHCVTGTTHFRLPQTTKRPMIRGPQTAKVVAASGDEIMVDKYGRVKVKFHWDRTDGSDEDRTCWIRVAQSWASASWGAVFIPRAGMEVVVEFLEGNPDRPLITGVVYNANNMVPYTLPDNKTQTGFKSNSSQGGNGSNELRFEDKAGSEEFYIHAQKDFVREVEHDDKHTIKNDQTHTIKHDQTSTVTNNRSVTVEQGNDSKTVSAGNHKIDVSAGKSEITAAQSITLTVGGNSLKIDTSGITINGMKIDVSANTTMSVQANATLTLQGAMVSIN